MTCAVRCAGSDRQGKPVQPFPGPATTPGIVRGTSIRPDHTVYQVLTVLALLSGIPAAAYGQDVPAVALTCQQCHPTEGADFARSAHSKADFDCRQCHGGEQSYELGFLQALTYNPKREPGAASRPAFDHGPEFRGKPTRLDVPKLCGDCHANVSRMNPYGLRTDQLAQYKTSQHGIRLFTAQDTRVAVCIDCHGQHAILVPSDPASSVNPLNVPGTCGKCHADPDLMIKYDVPAVIPSQYERSVHGSGLLEGHDTGMPNCATCHGNHGARPPGFSDIGHVCGKCHAQTADSFNLSVHAKFPNLPACVECHAATGNPLDHRIFKATGPPEQLTGQIGPSYLRLVAQKVDPQRIDAILLRQIAEADSPPLVPRLNTVCLRCHNRSFETGHRFFFEQLDIEANALGINFDEAIRQAQLAYVKASARVDEVSHGEILVLDEAMVLGQARTDLVALYAVQHTLDKQKILDTAGSVIDRSRHIELSLDRKLASLGLRRLLLWPVWGFALVFAVALLVKHHRLRYALVRPAGGPPVVGPPEWHEPGEPMSRRGFLDWFLAACGAVTGGLIVGPAVAYIWPSTQTGPVQQRVDAGAADTWEPWQAKVMAVAESPVLVVRMGDQFRAYSAVCSHLGCLVRWEPQQKVFLCPCHGGVFDGSGKVVSGPPPKPLTAFAVSVVQGKVYVSAA